MSALDAAGRTDYPVLGFLPLMAVHEVRLAEANDLLEKWAHPLGACRRPFGSMAHVMYLDGVPVACTVAASTVSSTVSGYERKQVVELARIGRADDAPWAMRPLLRLWRAVLALRWRYWPVVAAVSYALPGTLGDIYRFDGWERIKEVKRSSPGKGSTWSKPSVSDAIGDGRKVLWLYRYQPVEAVA